MKEGKPGISFGRYSDSPERNGIPAKQFGYIADNEEELESVAAQYEPKQVDISICVDDTLCKGVGVLGMVRPSAHQRRHEARRHR